MSDSDVLQIARDGRITLPNSVRRQAGLTAGDLLLAEVTPDGRILLTPVVAVERSQAYFWTQRWQAGEREAEDDLHNKRYETFTDIEVMISDLKNEG
ncbi:MAG: AbrB/MazE/SpoVT family DNA-binding domain-containing protein [Chloroflexota bacterium]